MMNTQPKRGVSNLRPDSFRWQTVWPGEVTHAQQKPHRGTLSNLKALKETSVHIDLWEGRVRSGMTG